MTARQAQELVGARVSAWTSANGVYAGVLEEVVVLKGRPWRGRVRIDGVLRVAQHFEIDRGVCRAAQMFRPSSRSGGNAATVAGELNVV
jgi:hypothetical protein